SALSAARGGLYRLAPGAPPALARVAPNGSVSWSAALPALGAQLLDASPAAAAMGIGSRLLAFDAATGKRLLDKDFEQPVKGAWLTAGAMLAELEGGGRALVDLASGSVLRPNAAPEGRVFPAPGGFVLASPRR